MKRFLTTILISASLVSFGQTNWKSLDDIPKKWIMVERDSLGYLVYAPCNGETPIITIDSGYVTIYWQLDGPSKLVINTFTRLTGNRSFYINAADEGGNMEFTARLNSGKRKLVICNFGD